MMASRNSSFSVEALHCHETFFEDEYMDEDIQEETCSSAQTPSLPEPLLQIEHVFRDELLLEEELQNLLSRERREVPPQPRSFVWRTCSEAVKWMVRASCHHEFSTVTSILAINYLDRFVSACTQFPQDVAWAVQLAAVACLSLAAKVEETRVPPLLIDLQAADETKHVFEANTVQRMELVILSFLEWRMNPVTPLSFTHHFLKICQLETHLHSEFVRKFEALILSVVSDSRSLQCYLPSRLAMAVMLHILDGCSQFSNGSIKYRNRLMSVVLNFSDDEPTILQLVREVSFDHHRNDRKMNFTSMVRHGDDDQLMRHQINVGMLEDASEEFAL